MVDEVASKMLAPPDEYLIYPENDRNHPRALFIHNDERRGYKDIVAKYFDPETKYYYNDDSKKKLYVKQVLLPIQAACLYGLKTAYHVTCIGIFVEFGKTIFDADRQCKPLKDRLISELVCMVKAPAYGIAIVIISLSSIIISPFKNTYVYTVRKIIAKLEDEYNEGSENGFMYAANCFQAFSLEEFNDNKEQRTYQEGAAKSAQHYAKFRRTYCEPCNDFGRRLSYRKAYRSAILTSADITYAETLQTAAPK